MKATTDISSEISQSELAASRWSAELTAVLLSRIQASIPGAELDWDRDAGESWGRLLLEKQPFLAIHNRLPFALVLQEAYSTIQDSLNQAGVISIVASDWDTPSLAATGTDIARAFCCTIAPESFDVDRFSLGDLWWLTI